MSNSSSSNSEELVVAENVPFHEQKRSTAIIVVAFLLFWPVGIYLLWNQSPKFRKFIDVTFCSKASNSFLNVLWMIMAVCGAIALLGAIGPVVLILSIPVLCILIMCLAVYGMVQDKQDNRWYLIGPLVIAGTFLAMIGKASMKSSFDEDK